MPTSIEYFMAPSSPWTDLGHERFVALPSYVLDGEIFWGQDRLELLQHTLESKIRTKT